MKMRLPKGNGAGMGNFQQLAQQAQKIQQEMDEATKELENKLYTSTSGGGAIEVTVSGKPEVKSIVIKPEVVDVDDLEMLSDMIIAATNEAIKQANNDKESTMQSISGQVHLPGLF